MTGYHRTALVCALFTGALAMGAASGARAADPGAPNGFAAKGSLTVQTELSGAKINVGGNIALEQRGQLVRIDVLSLSLPGVDSMLSSLASSQLFPPGGYSVVYDQAKHTYIAWSTSRKMYYENEGSGSSAPPPSNPGVAAATAVSSTSDILHAFSAARALRDYKVFSASLNLTGHGTTNGHPSTGVAFALKRQEKNATGDPLDVHGTLQLADDLNELPVQINASVNGAGGAPPSTLRLDFTSIDARTPPDSDFAVPAGFTKAGKITDILGRSLP